MSGEELHVGSMVRMGKMQQGLWHRFSDKEPLGGDACWPNGQSMLGECDD